MTNDNDQVLTVPDGSILTVARGKTLTNSGMIKNHGIIAGTLSNDGSIDNYGEISGTVTNNGWIVNCETINDAPTNNGTIILVKNGNNPGNWGGTVLSYPGGTYLDDTGTPQNIPDEATFLLPGMTQLSAGWYIVYGGEVIKRAPGCLRQRPHSPDGWL